MTRSSFGMLLSLLMALALAACAPAAPANPTAVATQVVPSGKAAPSTKASSNEATTVTYGVPVHGTTTLHLAVGQQKGFFERENINLDVVMTQSVPLIAQGLQGGSIQVGNLGPDVGFSAIEKGADIVYVAGIHNYADWYMIAQPDVSSYADLKGKALGVATLKGGSTTLLKRLLLRNGFKEEDIHFVQSGGTSGRIAALESKAIAGGLIATPHAQMMIRKDYKVLGKVNDVFPLYPLNGVAVTRKWANANEDVLLRVLRAHLASVNWINDPANRKEAAAILAEYAKAPPDVAAEIIEAVTGEQKMWSPQGRFELEGYRLVIDMLREDGEFSGQAPEPKKYIDVSYLRNLGVSEPMR